MPIIFNYGPQSGRERGTCGTDCFLRNVGPLLHQFCLKSLHNWVGREASLDLQDWLDEEVQRAKSGLLAGQIFLLMNEGTGWSWKRERVQSPVAGIRELLISAPWLRAAGNSPKCRRCSAGSSIWLQRTQKAEGTSRYLWRPSKPWQTTDFGVWWRSLSLWMTRKPKLGHCAGLPPAGCLFF